MKKNAIFWIREDFRIEHNPALSFASQNHDNVIALFIYNKTDFDKKKTFVKDHFSGFLGPLSGVLTGMKWAEKYYPIANWILTVPVDSPFFPDDLLKKFRKNLNDELIVTAKSGDKTHPVFSMWNLSLIKSLELSIKQGILKIDEFTKNFKTKVVNFPIIDYDPFYNINNLEDLSVAEEIHDKFFS